MSHFLVAILAADMCFVLLILTVVDLNIVHITSTPLFICWGKGQKKLLSFVNYVEIEQLK